MQLVVIFFLDESITIAAVVFPQKSSKASAKADVIQSSEIILSLVHHEHRKQCLTLTLNYMIPAVLCALLASRLCVVVVETTQKTFMLLL